MIWRAGPILRQYGVYCPCLHGGTCIANAYTWGDIYCSCLHMGGHVLLVPTHGGTCIARAYTWGDM
ncbi:unnamed protein product, partial [Staurois parvus]